VFSVAGLIAAALATRLLLPALMPDGASGERCWQRLSRVAAGAPRVLPRWRLAFGLAGVAGLLIVAAAHGRLWNADLASLSPVTPGEQALDAALRADLGANDARTLVVAGGPDREAALRAAEAAGPALDALVADGVLAGYDSPARLLPSAAEQARRRHAIPDAATLRARLAEAAANTPWQAARLEPFIAEAELARDAPPITAGTLDGTALKPVLDGLLVPRRGGGWAALMPLQAPGGAGVDAHAVRQGLARAHAPGAQVVDLKASLDELYLRYLADARRLALLGGAAVVGLVAWRLRSARRVGAVIVPLALAVAIVLGGFAAAGAALGILHLVGLLLIVAIGSNYGLFFDRWGAAGPPDLHAPASLLLANMTTVIAFGLLALSSLPVLSALGRVVAPGVLLALAASAAFGRQADRA
jgi:predicted exporter